MRKKKKSLPGRPPKPEAERGKPIGLRLSPPLLERLNRLRSGRTWPVTLTELADLAEGKASAPQ